MIRAFFLAVLALLAAPASAQSPLASAPIVTAQSATALAIVDPDAKAMPTKLVWSDEFTKPALDTTKWHCGYFRFPGWPHDTTLAPQSGETQRYDCADVVFDSYGGTLHLRIENDPEDAHLAWVKAVLGKQGASSAYAGDSLARLLGVTKRAGMVTSFPDLVVTPGSMIEARIKLPVAKGTWANFWMFDYATLKGEIDGLEGDGQGDIKVTVHNEATTPPGTTVTVPNDWFTLKLWRDQANKRVVEQINGKTVAVLPAGTTNDVAMSLIIGIAGGTPNWSFIGLPDATTPRTPEMLVDYVRVYGP